MKKLLFLLVVLANLLHAEDAPCFDPIGKLDWDFFIDNIELKFERFERRLEYGSKPDIL